MDLLAPHSCLPPTPPPPSPASFMCLLQPHAHLPAPEHAKLIPPPGLCPCDPFLAELLDFHSVSLPHHSGLLALTVVVTKHMLTFFDTHPFQKPSSAPFALECGPDFLLIHRMWQKGAGAILRPDQKRYWSSSAFSCIIHRSGTSPHVVRMFT